MIVISAGMEKSGSAFCFNLINDLMIQGGKNDVRNIKKKFRLESMLELNNCNIRELTCKKLLTLFLFHIIGKSFVVKTHFPPTRLLSIFTSLRFMRPIYIYRDPRDIILSAIDHGRMHRDKDQLDRYFARFVSVENSISLVKDYILIWEKWMAFPKTLKMRYEDLVDNPMREMDRICGHLKLKINREEQGRIIEKYSKDNIKNLKMPLHFNIGQAERYKTQMSEKEKELCLKYFGDHLKKMGYLQKDR